MLSSSTTDVGCRSSCKQLHSHPVDCCCEPINRSGAILVVGVIVFSRCFTGNDHFSKKTCFCFSRKSDFPSTHCRCRPTQHTANLPMPSRDCLPSPSSLKRHMNCWHACAEIFRLLSIRRRTLRDGASNGCTVFLPWSYSMRRRNYSQ